MMVKSSSAADGQTIRPPAVHRHRKTVSTGGGRAWSEAEVCVLQYVIGQGNLAHNILGSISN